MDEITLWAKNNYKNTADFWMEFTNRFVALAREREDLLPELKVLFAQYEAKADQSSAYEEWM